jgi:Zn-dependent protease
MIGTSRGLFVARIAGIRFYLDYSWFVIAAALTFVLATSFFPQQLPAAGAPMHVMLGLLTAVLFFTSILLHELGHSVVSQRCGIPVPRITLMFIGGLAEISREPQDPGTELKIAIAGPAVTLVLILLCQALVSVFQGLGFTTAAVISQLLAVVNLQLIVFNMIPGYPLDGGRVLRALIWARTGNVRRATFITSRIGVALSWILIGLGALLLLQRMGNGFVLIVVGIFLKGAAESGYMQTVYHEVLDGVRVRDIMTRDPAWIPASLPLSLAVDDFFLAHHHVAFPVCADDQEFRGILRIEHLKTIERAKWPYTTAGDLAASNGTANQRLPMNEPAVKALRRLLVPGHGRLAVTDGNQLVGFVTRHDILQFIRIRSELEPGA